MNRKIRWITQTAVMLALLIALQAATKGFGQLVTGACVNTVLAVSVLLGGISCGITVAVISPVLAFWLNIAPQILTVPAIMVGNVVFVLVLYLFSRRGFSLWRRLLSWLTAAVAKFVVLYGLVAFLLCNVLADRVLQSGLLSAKQLTALPATFGAMQLFTALIGGGIALLITPVLRKALRR